MVNKLRPEAATGGLMVVGCNIDGSQVLGHIVVQTPYYMKAGVFNVIDEFQFLSPWSLNPLASR